VFFVLFVLKHGFSVGYLGSVLELKTETDCSIPRCDGMLYACVKLVMSLSNVGL